MHIYNTLSRSVEKLIPLHEKKVGLYACGFTVYDYTHLGHLRKYSMDDVLVRMLRHEGYEVQFVQNVTDVGHLSSDDDTGEDKLEKGAKKYHQSVWDIAKKFEDYFFMSMDTMGNLRPDVSCRATEHIPEQIALVQKLEEKGYTYIIDGDGVYFDTSKLDDYGKLAGLTKDMIEQMRAGARVEVVAGKRNITDFALWKFERPGENRAMVWESPWAKRGFPGWHIECSAMSMQYLGEQFDIHTGGIDHIDIHHTNEIAQSEAATGKKPFVQYWVHHNHLRVEGEKMSKSLGNFFTIEDVQAKGFAPQALRLLFLGSHYRSELNFTWDALAAAQKAWERLVRLLADLKQVSPATNFSPVAQEYADQFWSAMRNDLDTPKAMAVFWNVTKAELSPEELLGLLFEFDRVLGFTLAELDHAQHAQNSTPIDIATLPDPVRELLAQRNRARATQDWQQADQLREALQQAGFRVQDSGDNQAVFSLDKS